MIESNRNANRMCCRSMMEVWSSGGGGGVGCDYARRRQLTDRWRRRMHIYPAEQCEARVQGVRCCVRGTLAKNRARFGALCSSPSWLGCVSAHWFVYVYCVIQYCKCSDVSRVNYAYTNIHIIIIRLQCCTAPRAPRTCPEAKRHSQEESVLERSPGSLYYRVCGSRTMLSVKHELQDERWL